MAIQIRTTPAILTYNTIKPTQSIEQPKAQVEGSLTLSKIKIEGTLPKVQIDQEDAFNEAGLKNNTSFTQDNVAFAKQKMDESAGRIASQGDQLTNIHKGGNPIAEQGYSNAYDQFEHEFGMVTMPKSGAKTSVIEGQLNISVEEGQITGTIKAQKPIIENRQGRLEKQMKQYGSISIRYIGEKVDLKV